jgi:hypothetical protein
MLLASIDVSGEYLVERLSAAYAAHSTVGHGVDDDEHVSRPSSRAGARIYLNTARILHTTVEQSIDRQETPEAGRRRRCLAAIRRRLKCADRC